jgi:hypothetical protein
LSSTIITFFGIDFPSRLPFRFEGNRHAPMSERIKPCFTLRQYD